MGTPGIVQFIDGAGADKTSYTTGQQVCLKVTDLDQAGTGSVTVSVSPGSRSLTLSEVGGTGVFSGCFSGPDNPFTDGDVLGATYTDPNDATDVATDTALVTDGAVPSLLLSKTRVAPADGIAVVGEPVRYDISVTNPGAASLATVSLTDTYSSACYTFQSATRPPDTNSAGSLAWTNVGPIAAGGSIKLSVTLIAKSACDTTAATNSVSAGGSATAGPATATVTINNPAVTVTKTRTSVATANVGDTVTFDIQVINSGNTDIATLPVTDTYSTCLEFVSATPAATSAGGGAILWSNLGALNASASRTIQTSFKVIGACDPAQNSAEVNFAVDVNGDTASPGSGSATLTTEAASIGGQVVNDADGDGVKDGGETGIPGVTVRLYRDSDGDGDLTTGTVTLVAVQTTDGSGNYQFLNLAPNTDDERYVIVETDPANHQSTNDADGDTDAKKIDNKIILNVAAIQDYPDQNFLDVRPTISGQVVDDANNNGTKDSGETGIAGVTISLHTDVNDNGIYESGTDTLVSLTTTDASGNYRFLSVPAGNYLVVETDPSGATSTGDKDGNAPTANGFNTIAIGSFSPNAPSSGNDFLDYFAPPAPDVFTSVDAPASVAAGDPVTALLTFGNQGTAPAEGVTYAVTLPTNLTGVGCTGATCDYDPDTGELTLSGLPKTLIPGQIEQVLVYYTAPATAPGSGKLEIESEITTTTASETPTDNNTANAETTLTGASSSVVDVAAWLTAPPSAATGSTVNVPVNFTNLGGTEATGVTYDLSLPAGLSGVTCTGSGVSCAYNSGTGEVTITGLPDTLAPGQTVGLILSYTAPAASASPVDATATVSAANDNDSSNDEATGSTIINDPANDLDVISLVAPPASAAPGGTVTVPVSYSNLGPDPATVTAYSLTLSATGSAPTNVEIRNNGALCTYSGTTLTGCGLPDTLDPGQTVDLVLTYTAPASGTVTVSSDIEATGPAPGNAAETNTANNPSTGSTLIAAASVPDVYTNVDVPASVPAGSLVNALVTFGNQGATQADDVSYTLVLPPNLSGVSCTGAACDYDPATGVVTLGGLPDSLSPGQGATVLVSYPAPASGAASLTVQSAIATTTPGETPTNNNSASASTTVAGSTTADVTTWINAPATANGGATVTVTAGFTNLGTADATGVTYGLSLPAGATVSHNGTLCSFSGGLVSGCGLPSTLIPGQIVTLVATYTAPVSGPVVVTSDVDATNDSDDGNNAASASTAINGAGAQADIATTVAPPPSATAGSSVSVPISVTNLGPASATGMGYALSLTGSPADVLITHEGATCTYSGGAITDCGLPTTLNVGETLNLTLTYTAPASGSVGVASTVSTQSSESNTRNNTASGTTGVIPVPGVDVYALVDAPSIGAVDSTVEVALTFGNAGDETANDVTYSALLPAGLSGVSCDAGITCDYDSASGLVSISGLPDTLGPGSTQTLTLTYDAPSTIGTVPVTGRVSASEDPGLGGNNSATDTTAIMVASVFDPPSGFKTVNAQGAPIHVWRMVWINNGNAVANLVRVEDPIPAGTTLESGPVCEARGASTTSLCQFEAARNRVVWQGSIAPDQGALTESQAQNEVVISFATRLLPGATSPSNLASAYWDTNGDDRLTDDEWIDNQAPALTNGGVPTQASLAVPIPVLPPVGLLLLAGLLMLLGGRRLGRR